MRKVIISLCSHLWFLLIFWAITIVLWLIEPATLSYAVVFSTVMTLCILSTWDAIKHPYCQERYLWFYCIALVASFVSCPIALLEWASGMNVFGIYRWLLIFEGYPIFFIFIYFFNICEDPEGVEYKKRNECLIIKT